MTLLERRLAWQKLRRARLGDDVDLKVALLASFTVNPIVAYLGTALDAQGFSAAVEVGPFDQHLRC